MGHGHEHWKIEVTVFNCRSIKGVWREHADLSVIVRYEGQVRETKADKDHGNNPKFNETLQLEVKHEPCVLDLEVKDNDPQETKILGYTKVDFSALFTDGVVKGLFPIQEGPTPLSAADHHGEIELEVKLIKA